MFFSKTPGTFVQHLPSATRAALEKSGALATLQQFSLLTSQVQGQNLQTFETGSMLLVAEDPKTNHKVEITVTGDSLHGDQDDIALSFQTYKDGQAQRTPYVPQVTFSMKQEAQVWKLNEISVTIHVPLADPEFLKLMTEQMKPHGAAASLSPLADISCGQRCRGGGLDANDCDGGDRLCQRLSDGRIYLHTVQS
jgi:hypothetical protein